MADVVVATSTALGCVIKGVTDSDVGVGGLACMIRNHTWWNTSGRRDLKLPAGRKSRADQKCDRENVFPEFSSLVTDHS